jgi:HK97 gp10 family phage protein
MEVKVTGLKELRDALVRKIPLEMQGKVLQKAMGPAARLIVNAARVRAPVDTGRMRKAIYAARDKRNSKPTFEARVVTVRRGKKKDDPKGAYYWKFVEFGHRIGTSKTGYLAKKGSSGATVPPKPFLRPAFEGNKHAALQSIRQNLAVQIEKAAKKARFGK